MTDEKRTVFYSWQSEVSPKTCRNFIEDALKAAAKGLRSDPNVEELPEVVIDQGAANTPGALNIAEVILRKIDAAPALVFDVTLIPHQDTRQAPNANVLVELGYALKSVGQERIVLVMNTAFGKPEALPFDLRFRNVITYRLAEGEAKPEVRKALTAAIEGKLRTILEIPSRDMPAVELALTRSRPRTHQDKQGYTHTHDYTLVAKLTNTSKKRIDDWQLEVEMPTPPLNAIGIIHTAMVEKRSNERTTLLRYPGREPLQAGDSFESTIQYRVTHDLYYRYRDVLDTWIAKAVAYVDGETVVEQVLAKFQEF